MLQIFVDSFQYFVPNRIFWFCFHNLESMFTISISFCCLEMPWSHLILDFSFETFNYVRLSQWGMLCTSSGMPSSKACGRARRRERLTSCSLQTNERFKRCRIRGAAQGTPDKWSICIVSEFLSCAYIMARRRERQLKLKANHWCSSLLRTQRRER